MSESTVLTGSASHETAVLEEMVERDVANRFPTISHIDVSEALRTGVVFVDVRSAQEFAVSAIPNAIHRDQFEAWLPTKGKNTNRLLEEASTICFYCTIGVRSAKYIQYLNSERYPKLAGKHLCNLKGSILAWCFKSVNDSSLGLIVPSTQSPTHAVHCYGDKWCVAPDGFECCVFPQDDDEKEREDDRWTRECLIQPETTNLDNRT